MPAPQSLPATLSVSQLNRQARHLLEDVFGELRVEGELSGLSRPSSGHVYFTLKDATAQVRCALFRHQALRLHTPLRDGLAIQVQGRLSLFETRGDYQLIVSQLEPAGEGALRQAFETLKIRLTAEGLFTAGRKRPLPEHPRRIGIITSPTGAAIRDIISVFARRAPQIELLLIPSSVQGREAAGRLVQALALADRQGLDALILGRGGGSLEDLWCFNEEAVARAIAACQTPVVSAVGHETDVSISDFVADLRAPTPSAAAEILSPDQRKLQQQLAGLQQRLILGQQAQLTRAQLQLRDISSPLRHPLQQIGQYRQQTRQLEQRLQQARQRRLERAWQTLQQLEIRLRNLTPRQQLKQLKQQQAALAQRLEQAIRTRLERQQQQLRQLGLLLHGVSPLATLTRGYSILQDAQGQIIRRPDQVQPGQTLQARLATGSLQLQVAGELQGQHLQKGARRHAG